MSSLQSTTLRIASCCLLSVAACKPTDVAVSKPTTNHSFVRTVSQPRFRDADDSFDDLATEFIDQAEIEDPIDFARKVVALSNGDPIPFPEVHDDIGTNYETVTPSGPQTEEQVAFPFLEPQSPREGQLTQALQEARMRDLEARENEKWGALNQQRLDYEEAMEGPPTPIQVTRFDRGLGIEIDHLVQAPPVRTTGRSRFLVEADEVTSRDCMFMNQVIGDQTRPGRFFPLIAFPANNGIRPTLLAPPPNEPPGCNDGRDNNANGLVDSQDPVCWDDRTNPGTYNSQLTESEPFDPFGSFVGDVPAPPSTIAPSAPAVLTPPSPPVPLQLPAPVAPLIPSSIPAPTITSQ